MTLTGVPETALWTLYHRALAAGQGVLEDPKAIELVDRIDHPFRERFGGGELAPWQGLRVRAFDREIRRVLREEPDATVVALGEGLETQFWRVDNGRMRWVTVDLPESVALRERLLPAGERQTTIAASALDVDRWIATRPSLITAQGLLMYLDRESVHGLLARLPPAALLFDVVSKRLAAHSGKPRQGYQPPAWTYGVDRRELASLPVRDLERVHLPHGRGALAGFVVPLASRVARLVSIYRARTIAASSSTITTPATTSTAASATNAASAAREATRATRCDA
jgi:O-methyltransferase involved in polyketide biosynthesis